MNWQEVDKILKQYLSIYKNKQQELIDKIQDIFNIEITDVNKRITNNDLSKFKRYLENNKENIKDNNYIAYMINKYKNKVIVKYKDMLKLMLLVEYGLFEENIKQDQIDTLTQIGSMSYETATKMCEDKGFEKEDSGWAWHDAAIIAMLLTPLNTGLTFEEQNNTTAIYNAEEIYKKAIVDIEQNKKPNVNNKEYQLIFQKQQKREINKKKDNKQLDKFSGLIDNQSTFVINQVMVEVFKAFGVDMVEFKALTDDKSTIMCQTLKGQKFYVDKMNVYDRYSQADDRNVVYHSQGLVLGENLPPINNNFHWCRSWIEPYKEK